MFRENSNERRIREMREIEAMMEQTRFRAVIQKLNEQKSGQNSSSGGVGGGKKPLNSPPTPPQPTTASDWIIYIEPVYPYELRATNLFTGEEIKLGTLPLVPNGLIGITAREKPGMPGFMEIDIAEAGVTTADPVTLYRAEVPSIIASPITWDSGTILTPTPTPVGTTSVKSLAYAGDSLYFLYANKNSIEVRLGAVNFVSNTINISTVITGWTPPGALALLGESTSTTVLLGSYVQGGLVTPTLHYWQAYDPVTYTYTPVYTDLVAPTSGLVTKLSRRPGPSGEHLGIYAGTFVGAPWLINSLGINVVPQPSPLSTQIGNNSLFAWTPASWTPAVV